MTKAYILWGVEVTEDVRNLGHLLLKRVQNSKDNQAIGFVRKGKQHSLTYFEYFDQIALISKALENLELKAGERIAILAQTSPEWHFLDLASMVSRLCVVPIYPSYTSEEVEFLLEHAEVKALAIDSNEQGKKILHCPSLEKLKTVIAFNPLKDDVEQDLKEKVSVTNWKDLLEQAQMPTQEKRSFIEEKITHIQDQDLASIVYTSGTTGKPKGTLITHDAMSSMLMNVESSTRGVFTERDSTLTWLPLSHVFGRCDSLLPLVFGWKMCFARSMETLLEDLTLFHPSLMLAVPRIFEKIYEKISMQREQFSFVKQKVFHLAMDVANRYYDAIERDQSPSPKDILLYQLAKKAVFSKITEKFGENMRFFVSGGAALSAELAVFFRNIGITVLEGYGLTETLAPCCLNPPRKQIPGTVGIPLNGMKISVAEDGEILIEGRALFSGYYKNPSATEDVLKDGVFHTGDIGEFDQNGHLKITDRKKDLIITSGGKNVAPQKIEGMAKLFPPISQFVVVGEGQKFLSAIICPNLEYFIQSGQLQAQTPRSEAIEKDFIQTTLKQTLKQLNSKLASFESIKKFTISPLPLDQDNGFLTPSLKMKRREVTKRFHKEIEALYGGED